MRPWRGSMQTDLQGIVYKDAKNLYELFEQRSGNNPTIFVGQYPFDEWHNRLGGGTQTDSIMDRIIHNAYEIPTNETTLLCRL